MTTGNRDEFQRAAISPAARAAETARRLQLVSQAAVSSSHLTGHPAWDRYLSYLQAAVETTEDQARQFMAKLADPLLVDPVLVMQAKISLCECNARVAAWKAALSLPKDIMEQGDKARSLMERMEAS